MTMVLRMLALILSAVQGYGIIVTLINSEAITLGDDSPWGYTKVIVFMIAGTMLLVWLGDQITDKGIGNGLSIIIAGGIIAQLPTQIVNAFRNFLGDKVQSGDSTLILQGSIQIIVYLLAFFLIVVFVAFVEKSVRKLPVSHLNQSKTTELSAKQSSYLTININVSSVLPVIFVSSLMVSPSILISLFSKVIHLNGHKLLKLFLIINN